MADTPQSGPSIELDTTRFKSQIAELRGLMEASLQAGADNASRGITSALSRATRAGKLEFEDLAKVAGRALGALVGGALSPNAASSAGPSLGLGSLFAAMPGITSGYPGRATGGAVAAGRPYLVGERGPELFVPTSAGQVQAPASARAPINITVNVASAPSANPMEGRQTAWQVARQVRRAIEKAS